MRNKLSFDLQLSARKRQSLNGLLPIKLPAVKCRSFNGDVRWRVYGDRIYFYLSVIADAPSSQALTHLVGGLCFTLGFILLAVCGTNLFTSSVMTVMAKVGALLVGELG